LNPLRHKLATQRTVCGIWCIAPAAASAGALACAGFDFVILDCEHGRWDLGELEGAIAVCEAEGAGVLVRSPGADAFFVQRVLDLGADGVLLPQIQDAEAATRAVALAHFAPRGTRGYNPFTRGGRFGAALQPKLAAGYPFTGVLVESPSAARHLDAIVALPDLDFLYLGIFDYSVALGIPGEVDDTRVQRFVEDAARKARAAGKAVGTTAMSPEQVRRWTDLGVNVLLYGTDTWLLSTAGRAGLGMLRGRAS